MDERDKYQKAGRLAGIAPGSPALVQALAASAAATTTFPLCPSSWQVAKGQHVAAPPPPPPALLQGEGNVAQSTGHRGPLHR